MPPVADRVRKWFRAGEKPRDIDPRDVVERPIAQVSNEVGQAAPAGVSSTDIANCYRLFLGRSAETDEVVRSKIGQTWESIQRGFLLSDEFRDNILKAIACDRVSPGLLVAAGPDLVDWTCRTFDVARDALPEQPCVLQLLGMALERPVVAQIVDGQGGAGTAQALAIKAKAKTKATLDISLQRPTTAVDVQHCYALFLQRSPETPGLLRDSDTPLAVSVVEFVRSPEFAENVAYPALDAAFPRLRMLAPAVLQWGQNAFGLRTSDGDDAPSMIAAILSRADIRRLLESADLGWDVDEVVRGMRCAAGRSANGSMTLQHRLEQVAAGIEIGESCDIMLSDDGHRVMFNSDDPWVRLRPVGEALTGDFVEFRCRVSMKDGPVIGRLYLDYGEGFAEENSIGLLPKGDGFQIGRVAAPRKLVAVRWDPSAQQGLGCISSISARPISIEDHISDHFSGREENAAVDILRRLADEGSSAPNAPLAMTITRLISPVISESGDINYAAWILRNEPQGAMGRHRWLNDLAALPSQPLISVIVPVYNPDEALLVEMIESVTGQVYPNWQLCLADDASPSPHVRAVIERYAAHDSRIRTVFRERNGHISHASNSALDLADGEWIAMLDHDDLLAPNALLAIAQAIVEQPDAELIYSDEDKIDERGQRLLPSFKPQFSPELLLAMNYFNHLTAMRTSTVRALGGWRPGFEGSQDHDLALRVVERVRREQVVHVPKVLYHWRAITGSTALGGGEKAYTTTAGIAAVQDHIDRAGKQASVELLTTSSHYRVRFSLPKPHPLVSLIIPTRDKADILKVAVDSILQKSTYAPYEIVIVDNGSVEHRTFELFRDLESDERVRVVRYDKPFNYSAINNFGAEIARGSVLALVNNDVEVISPDWIEEMTAWAIQPEIGCVGAKLYYPDETIQHGGVIIGLGGVAGHSHKHFQRHHPGYMNRLGVHQNLSAVTAACLFIRREVFEEVGGLETELSVAFNDVDFCLRVREAGYRNLFTPFAELFHYESISRGAEDNPEKIARAAGEVAFMKKRWQAMLTEDPFYSPNLTYDREDFSLSTTIISG